MGAMMASEQTTTFVECPCVEKTLERLIRPAVLMVLAQGTLYGYKIVQRLAEMPMFDGQKPNAAGVYRTLKTMMEEGLVVSEWELSATGPAKRQFTLTDQGEHCLARWIITLHKYQRDIDALLAVGEEVAVLWRARGDAAITR